MAQAIVDSFASLRTAALDPGIDYIYLNADIMLGTGGILLPKNKPLLTIDGLYPTDETGTVHTITDMNDLLQSNAIRIANVAGSYHLTIKNCKVIGRNYFGIISCVNSGQQNTTTLTLENIDYSGPQSSYNRYGTVEIIGGKYNIGKLNGTLASTNEMTEANILIMSGNIDIYHDGTPNSCLYVSEANPKFILKEGANLNVEVVSRELFFNDVAGMDFTMEANSRLHAKTRWSMFWSSGMAANFISIGAGAELVFDQQAERAGVATINCRGNFTAGPGSRIIVIKKNFSSTDPLLQFTATATADFQDPLAVVLYNSNGRVIHWASGTGTIKIDAEIVNRWTTATAFPNAGGFSDIPLYNWCKVNGDNATINATLSSSSTTAVTTNLIQNIDAPVIPTTTSFNVQSTRVLAFGRLPFNVNPPKEADRIITGTTLSGANVRVGINGVYTYSDTDYFGLYSIIVNPPLEKHDSIVVSANMDFKIKNVQFATDGIIQFLVLPERLPFVRVAAPVRSSIYGRTNPDWAIIVRDSRDNGGTWSVYAHASGPLTSPTSQLSDALVFKTDELIASLEGLTEIKIFEGAGNTAPDYTDTTIKWAEIEGLLMRLQAGTNYDAGRYEAEIVFSLVEEEVP